MAHGDHLFVYCRGYSHHGIELENGNVVHFESDPWRKFAGTFLRSEPPEIREVPREEFALGREVFVRPYVEADAPAVVAARARARVGERGYHVFGNNCEHFAVWCKTGRAHSTQIDSLRQAARPLGKDLASSAMLLRHARRLPTSLRPWAYGTALAMTAGSFAARYVRCRLESMRRGES